MCGSEEYELEAPGLRTQLTCNASVEVATSNRVCAPMTPPCSQCEYERVAPSATNDRVCATVSQCYSHEYEVREATATSDTVCAPLTLCNAFQYEVPPTTVERLSTACLPEELFTTTSPATTTTAPLCRLEGAELLASSQGPESPGSRLLNGIGHPEDELQLFSVLAAEASLASVRCECYAACVLARECQAFFILTANEKHTCKTLSSVGSLSSSTTVSESFVMLPRTTTTATTTTTPLPTAPGETVSTSATTVKPSLSPFLAVSNRICINYTQCDFARQYELTPATATSDRVCANQTQCTATQYASVLPTLSADRECEPLRECTESEFESVPPTATSNRECQT